MRISDWSSDVCSSDLSRADRATRHPAPWITPGQGSHKSDSHEGHARYHGGKDESLHQDQQAARSSQCPRRPRHGGSDPRIDWRHTDLCRRSRHKSVRSEEHTSELQSLMRISYAVFCLKKKKKQNKIQYIEKQSTTEYHENEL